MVTAYFRGGIQIKTPRKRNLGKGPGDSSTSFHLSPSSGVMWAVPNFPPKRCAAALKECCQPGKPTGGLVSRVLLGISLVGMADHFVADLSVQCCKRSDRYHVPKASTIDHIISTNCVWGHLQVHKHTLKRQGVLWDQRLPPTCQARAKPISEMIWTCQTCWVNSSQHITMYQIPHISVLSLPTNS